MNRIIGADSKIVGMIGKDSLYIWQACFVADI